MQHDEGSQDGGYQPEGFAADFVRPRSRAKLACAESFNDFDSSIQGAIESLDARTIFFQAIPQIVQGTSEIALIGFQFADGPFLLAIMLRHLCLSTLNSEL